MDRDKIIILAKKLKALVDRGVGGEAENAASKLSMLLTKHNLNMDDIEEPEIKRYTIKVKKSQNTFFNQICWSVNGDMWISVWVGGEKDIKCTHTEHVEVLDKFNHYWLHYQSEMDMFYRAFIQKNRLFSKDSKRDKNEPPAPLTPAELAELYRLAQMMDGIQAKTHLKKIG